MSITDELREWMDRTTIRFDGRGCLLGTAEDLTAIADRIDEAHERKVAEVASGWDYWESTHVELPKDAHGECIHVGDTLDGYGRTIEVVEMRYGRSGWVLISRDGNGYADTFAFAHHHEPTVEDVLREFAERYLDYEGVPSAGRRGIGEELMDEYAAKLCLAGEDV